MIVVDIYCDMPVSDYEHLKYTNLAFSGGVVISLQNINNRDEVWVDPDEFFYLFI